MLNVRINLQILSLSFSKKNFDDIFPDIEICVHQRWFMHPSATCKHTCWTVPWTTHPFAQSGKPVQST